MRRLVAVLCCKFFLTTSSAASPGKLDFFFPGQWLQTLLWNSLIFPSILLVFSVKLAQDISQCVVKSFTYSLVFVLCSRKETEVYLVKLGALGKSFILLNGKNIVASKVQKAFPFTQESSFLVWNNETVKGGKKGRIALGFLHIN